MGQFIYNSLIHVTIPDSDLANLEAVVGRKFVAQEPFYFSWNRHVNTGECRTTIWLHPSISLHFRYLANRRPALNRIRVAEMLLQANSVIGLMMMLDDVPPSSNRPLAA